MLGCSIGADARLYLRISKAEPENNDMKYPGLSYRSGVMILLGVISPFFLNGCANQAQQSFDRPPAPVSVTVAITQDVPTYLDAIGKTVANETVSIQSQVSGRIVKIHFTDGANVKKNDLLFTIDSQPFEANVRQAQANLSKIGR